MKGDTELRLSLILTNWYNKNKRELPWRDTCNPYIIWISEIILQQTRVDQGYSYFNRFVFRFPSVDLLAKADEDEVLKLWQGLGYYSRARNLHAAAKMIMDNHNGVFPRTYKDILSLKGVGEYTAAAIISFAYNEPYAVVDGNVYRVLSRIFAIDEPIDSTRGKKIFAELAQELLDKRNPGLHNQAIMEFGALQCVPVSPDCPNCPVSPMCMAYAEGKVNKYPVKEGKQKTRNRYLNYFDIRDNDSMLLHKRDKKDIWQNLYELPLIETDNAMRIDELLLLPEYKKLFGELTINSIALVTEYKHILSHQIIYATFYHINVKQAEHTHYLKIKSEDIGEYPVSRLVHKYLENL